MYKIILASNSPRREELLKQVDVSFAIIPSNKEEVTTKDKPEEIVEELALNKAKDIATSISEASIIIGADTMVSIGNEILGKPKTHEDAKKMLKLIEGKEHQVYTGVGIVIKNIMNGQVTEKTISFTQVSQVKVSPLNEKQIEDYIATKEPFDKAGAYGIQGKFAIHIEGINGDYNNIVGLPIAKIYRSLLEVGIDIISE